MNTVPLRYCTLITVMTVTACTSVPEVEDRLKSIQFHSNMYVVQAGETADTIAFRYAMSPQELEALNPGLSENIEPGLRINVRPGTELSDDVRTRASYAPESEPLVVGKKAVVDEDDVVLKAIADTDPVVVERMSEASPATDPELLAASGLREEIIPDTLDFEPVDAERAAMDDELQQMVGEWTWPTNGQVAREFAPHEAGGQGVDIAGVPGQEIKAAKSGTVVYSGRDLSGGGNLIIVRHDDNLMTTYSHADNLFVAEDDMVGAGDTIASLGWNEKQESVLRFEVRQDGNALDPMKFLPKQ